LICGGDVIVFLYSDQVPELKQCKNCGHCSFQKMPSLEILGDYYQTKYTEEHFQSLIQEENVNYYRSHVMELLTFAKLKNAVFLDYGSSYPYFLIEAAKIKGNYSIGVEFDESAREFGKSNGIKMLHPTQLDQIEDQSIDIIRCSHVLEHDTDPQQTLVNLLSKLKHGGIIYITQPNFPQIDLQANKEFLFDVVFPEHLHYFTPASLVCLTKNVGLKTLRFFSHTANSLTDGIDASSLLKKPQLNRYKQDLASVGDDFFGKQNNYPYFVGMNSFYVGVKEVPTSQC
jgi:2-polyprenyl-3-methyl-5-hydroxy-6-metoxy-1,4-benzoquinol methylase